MTRRIADLVGADGRGIGFDVPEWAVGPGFASEIVYVAPIIGTVIELDWQVNELIYAQAAIDSVNAGYDAVIINSWADYGLPAMRAALRVPAVGCGHAAMQQAVGLGAPFGVVTVWPPAMRPVYDRILARYRLQSQCAGVWFTTRNDELAGAGKVLEELHEGAASLVDRIEQQCHAAISHGSRTIVLGCTCMSPVRGELAKRLPIPVLDPLVTGHKTAELLLMLGVAHAEPEVPAFAGNTLRAMLNGTPLEPVPYAAECGDACETLQDPSTIAAP